MKILKDDQDIKRNFLIHDGSVSSTVTKYYEIALL